MTTRLLALLLFACSAWGAPERVPPPQMDTSAYFTITPTPKTALYRDTFYAVRSIGAFIGDPTSDNHTPQAAVEAALTAFLAACAKEHGLVNAGILPQMSGADLVVTAFMCAPYDPNPDAPNNEAYAVNLDDAHTGIILAGIMSPSLRGLQYGQQSLRQLILTWQGQTIVRLANVSDSPGVHFRFVKRSSGFWLDQAVRYKLNGGTYPLSLEQSDELAKRVAPVVALARERHLGLLGMVNMGNLYQGSDAAQEAAARLFVTLGEAGFTHLAIMNDDRMTLADAEALQRYGSYGATQVAYAKRIRAALQGLAQPPRLGFMPNHYTGLAVDEPSAALYREHLAPLGLAWFWAGDYIPGLPADDAHLTAIARATGAPKLWYYTNWPQVAGAYFADNQGASRHHQFMPETVELVTISTDTVAQRFPTSFITLADRLWNPQQYDPEQALRLATKEVVTPDSFAAFLALFQYLEQQAPYPRAEQFGPMYGAATPAARRAVIERRCDDLEKLVAACRLTPAASEPAVTAYLDGLANRRAADVARLEREEATFARPGQPRTLSCPRVDTAPVLDGRLDDPAWQAAAATTDFTDLPGKQPAPHQTTFQVVRTAAALHLAITCQEPLVGSPGWLTPGGPNPAPLAATPGAFLWWAESVELFLDPGHDQRDVVQLIVNPWGLWEAFTFDSLAYGYYGIANKRRIALPVTGAAAIGDQSWTVEVSLPLAALGAPPEGTWGLNLARNRRLTAGNGMKYSTWTPLTWGFQDAAHFGQLLFTP